jgi:predicted DNA-binding WGR domain protein
VTQDQTRNKHYGMPNGGRFAPDVHADSDVMLNPLADDVAAGPVVMEAQFVAGTSDKFYRVEQDGCDVTITYGRNGTAGSSSTKTFDSEAAAADHAAKQFASKLKKGYVPVETPGTTNAAVNELTEVHGIDQDVLPMLAKRVDPDEVAGLIASPNWVAQVKEDGDRAVIALRDGRMGAFNRQGQPKERNVAAEHLEAFAGLEGDWTFDGEIVGREYRVFDLIAAPGMSADATFAERHERLRKVWAEHGLDGNPAVTLVATAEGPEAKQALRDATKAARGEGIIFRRASGRYQHGGRSDDLLKDKFDKEADVVVMSRNPGRDSVEVGVRGPDGTLRRVGTVSTIGKGDIAPGDVVEARFKHVIDPANPIMVEARIMRVRTDKSADECDLDQFAYAGTNIGVDREEDQP